MVDEKNISKNIKNHLKITNMEIAITGIKNLRNPEFGGIHFTCKVGQIPSSLLSKRRWESLIWEWLIWESQSWESLIWEWQIWESQIWESRIWGICCTCKVGEIPSSLLSKSLRAFLWTTFCRTRTQSSIRG